MLRCGGRRRSHLSAEPRAPLSTKPPTSARHSWHCFAGLNRAHLYRSMCGATMCNCVATTAFLSSCPGGQLARSNTPHIRRKIANGSEAIARQFEWPLGETNTAAGDDPLGEEARYSPVKGLVHKFPGRVLWKLTCRCAAHLPVLYPHPPNRQRRRRPIPQRHRHRARYITRSF